MKTQTELLTLLDDLESGFDLTITSHVTYYQQTEDTCLFLDQVTLPLYSPAFAPTECVYLLL